MDGGLIEQFVQNNLRVYDRILPAGCTWETSEDFRAELRAEVDRVAEQLVKRASEFAAFHKREISEEDVNNAWTVLQMERL